MTTRLKRSNFIGKRIYIAKSIQRSKTNNKNTEIYRVYTAMHRIHYFIIIIVLKKKGIEGNIK